MDPARFLASIRRQVPGWDASGSPPYTFAAPVRPPEIVNAEAMRAAPTLLAGVLAIALLVALGLSLGATVNARRKDYAIYRAIGFRRAQVARSVRWQAFTTMAVGIVIGTFFGIVGGRLLWNRFADELGIARSVELPGVLLVLIAVGALLGAVASTVIPAKRAASRSPVAALTTQ